MAPFIVAVTPPALALAVRPLPDDAVAIGDDVFGCVDVAPVEVVAAVLAGAVLALVLVLVLLEEEPPQPAMPSAPAVSTGSRQRCLFVIKRTASSMALCGQH
ncbi:MAG: hypothetical protein ACLPUT_16165 [Solirubrobacteraceae bacterium]